MRIVIASPKMDAIRTGNRITASRWASILRQLGHEINHFPNENPADGELLVALHAVKSHEAIRCFREHHPDRPIVLGLSGTDIYPQPNALALESMRRANTLVVLQEKAIGQLPEDLHAKARVIVQSVDSLGIPVNKTTDPFVICVAGHLRDVKDPMRTALAARALPADSKIRIEHAGAILESKYHEIVTRELRENPRYHYCGELSESELRNLMRRSQATVLSSRAEGGAQVVGESIVEGTPIIGSRIDGVTGLVGERYPGLFPPGDTASLTRLLSRLENDAAFRALLEGEISLLASRFDPALEREAWKILIGEFSAG